MKEDKLSKINCGIRLNSIGLTMKLVEKILSKVPFFKPNIMAICTMQKGKSNWVSDVRFSNDSKLIATTAGNSNEENDSIKIWNISDGSLLRTITYYGVSKTIFSPKDNDIIASCGFASGGIRIWKISDGSLLNTLPFNTHSIDSITFSSDGKLIAGGSGGAGYPEDIKKAKLNEFEYYFKIWKIKDGKVFKTLNNKGDSIDSIQFSPDSKFLVLSISYRKIEEDYSWKYRIDLWDIKSEKVIKTFDDNLYANRGNWPCAVSFSPNSENIAFSSSTLVKLYNIKNDSVINVLRTGKIIIQVLCYSPDGKYLAIGLAQYGTRSTVQIWNLNLNRIVEKLECKTRHINSICFSPNGRFFAIATGDNTDIFIHEINSI